MDYQKRRKRLRNYLTLHNIKSFLLTDFYNILYLTGFKTLSPHEKEAKLVVTPDSFYFITDTRYQTEAGRYFKSANDVEVLIQSPDRTFIQIVSGIFTDQDIRQLGFEKHDLSYAWFEYLQNSLKAVQLKGLNNVVMDFRNQKDINEIDFMKKAASFTDECLADVLQNIKGGIRERDIMHRMESWVKSRGLEFSFDPIVAFDEHSALPHYNNKMSDGVLGEHSIILIDMGITYKDYCSDITRVFFHGKPTKDQEKAYNDLLHIQKKTISALQFGIKLDKIDMTARQGLIDKGYPAIPHSTGHGVGLEVHEGLRVAHTVRDELKEGIVLTIEPGIYFEGKWGMRIEDTVHLIDGKAQSLTQFPKNLIVL